MGWPQQNFTLDPYSCATADGGHSLSQPLEKYGNYNTRTVNMSIARNKVRGVVTAVQHCLLVLMAQSPFHLQDTTALRLRTIFVLFLNEFKRWVHRCKCRPFRSFIACRRIIIVKKKYYKESILWRINITKEWFKNHNNNELCLHSHYHKES